MKNAPCEAIRCQHDFHPEKCPYDFCEHRELRAQRDRMHRESNRALEQTRFFAEAGKALTEKYGGDLKARGRKLLEESAELMSEIANEWKLKQCGTEAARREVGDVLLVLCTIAYRLNCEPVECGKEKFAEVMKRA